MVLEFIETVLRMVRAGKWDELKEFCALMRVLLTTKTLTLRPGTPADKG